MDWPMLTGPFAGCFTCMRLTPFAQRDMPPPRRVVRSTSWLLQRPDRAGVLACFWRRHDLHGPRVALLLAEGMPGVNGVLISQLLMRQLRCAHRPRSANVASRLPGGESVRNASSCLSALRICPSWKPHRTNLALHRRWFTGS